MALPRELPKATRRILEAGQEVVHVSAVSVYEATFKAATGRLALDADLVDGARRLGFAPLPLKWEHARFAGELPLHHRDPFDRMLVAQAHVEGLTLVTRDERLGRYGVPILAA